MIPAGTAPRPEVGRCPDRRVPGGLSPPVGRVLRPAIAPVLPQFHRQFRLCEK